MNQIEFQGRVLGELGQISATLAVFGERQRAHTERIEKLETWRTEQRNDATATGRHEIAKLEAQLEQRQRDWRGWIGKAGLLVLGAVLASTVPVCIHQLGW